MPESYEAAPLRPRPISSENALKARHRGDESKGFIVTDMFRLEDGQPAEQWDALQPIDFATRFLFLLTSGGVDNRNPVF